MNRTYIQTSYSNAVHGSGPGTGPGTGADAEPGTSAEVGAGNAVIESCSESEYFDEANSTEESDSESDSGNSRSNPSYSGKTFGNLQNKVKNIFNTNSITDLLSGNDKGESIFTVIQASISSYSGAPSTLIAGSIVSSASKSSLGSSSALKPGSEAPSDLITGSISSSAS